MAAGALHHDDDEPNLPRLGIPVPLTPLVGRDTELARARSLLAQPDTRIITLIGPGGVGKTRLALELARTLADSYPDGAAFIRL